MVAFHLHGHAFHAKTLWNNFLGHGYLAVSFFFMLSGFILTRTYRAKWTAASYRPFLIARFARIYPVYLLALLLQLPFYAATPGKSIAVLFMVQSWTTLPSHFPDAWNYPAWTLSVEWFFYLSFPLLLLLLSRVRNFRLAIVAVILISLALDGPQAAIDRTSWLCRHVPLPLLRIPEFFLGMLLAAASAKKRLPAQHPATPRGTDLRLAALALFSLLLLSLNLHRFVILIILPFAAAVWLLSRYPSRSRSFLEARPLVLLGGASYAVYILQDPIRNWVSRSIRLPPPLYAWQPLIYALVLLATSLVVFLAIEQPARKAIRSLGRTRTARLASYHLSIPRKAAVSSPCRHHGAEE